MKRLIFIFLLLFFSAGCSALNPNTDIQNEIIDSFVLYYEDETIKHLTFQTLDLKDDFMIGVDISSLIELERHGGIFYNENGVQEDPLSILHRYGINTIRIRLWYEPIDAFGQSYGGGSNDLAHAILLAERAKLYDWKILLNIQYSDFWTDPGKQWMPKDWALISPELLSHLVYQYTHDVMFAFHSADINIDIVQIGNEINNGFLWPTGRVWQNGFEDLIDFLNMAIQAIEVMSPSTQIMIHLAGIDIGVISYFLDQLLAHEVTIDILGLSYYYFWHGDLETFDDTLETINQNYDMSIVIAEYSYPYTDKDVDYAHHIITSQHESLYLNTINMQTQVDLMYHIHHSINQVEHGIGTFYWEPMWIPIENVGWANEEARLYFETQNQTFQPGPTGWANQGLFSYSGKVLPSLNFYKYLK